MSRAPKLPILNAEERLLTQIAWAYYFEELTQQQIAARLSLTRLRVNKALSEARRIGLVRVSLNTAFSACPELEFAICRHFSLSHALVCPTPEQADQVRMMVAAALGHVLSTVLAEKRVKRFGVTWGNTLNLATRFIAPHSRPDLEVIAVMGGAPRGLDYNGLEITARIAEIMDARHSYFLAPLYADCKESRETMMSLDMFRDLVTKIHAVDALAAATCDLSQRSQLVKDGLPSDVSVDELRRAGGIGDIFGTVIDSEGRPIRHPINDRVMGIKLDEARRIPNIILAAGGHYKVVPILAALRAGLVNTLVTDEATARAVLRLAGKKKTGVSS